MAVRHNELVVYSCSCDTQVVSGLPWLVPLTRTWPPSHVTCQHCRLASPGTLLEDILRYPERTSVLSAAVLSTLQNAICILLHTCYPLSYGKEHHAMPLSASLTPPEDARCTTGAIVRHPGGQAAVLLADVNPNGPLSCS